MCRNNKRTISTRPLSVMVIIRECTSYSTPYKEKSDVPCALTFEVQMVAELGEDGLLSKDFLLQTVKPSNV